MVVIFIKWVVKSIFNINRKRNLSPIKPDFTPIMCFFAVPLQS